ncbi:MULTISPECIES: universal stress protein [Salinibaculum]|uniref:universal stress protein n=1 Tax=Salinibaculum TaxID=2732368 RepID=UPI0030CB66F2
MPDRILVPLDESDPSKKALDFAVEQYPEATLVAVHAIDPHDLEPMTGIETIGSYDELISNYEKRAKRILNKARETAEASGVDIETERLSGRAGRAIVDYVEDNDIDHVVIGSHGRRGTTRVLLGSVAETVIRRSPVPVTVVR